MLQPIVAALDRLIYIQQQLLEFAEQKRTILIERKMDELNFLVKQEGKLVKQLNQAESERETLAAELLQKHPALNFSQLVAQLPDEAMKQKLQSQMKLLQELLIELQAKNKVNERLLIDSMNFVQHMIDQVTKSKQQHFNYQPPLGQQKTPTNSRGFFDTKA